MNTTINGTQFDVSKNSSNDSTFDPQQSSPCPLSPRILSAINNSSVYVSDIMLTIVNIPSATFAFLVNLVIIVTIIRSPSLHRPANVLLCSLANADCLTGLVTQPVYVAWRLSLHHAEDPCALTHLFQASKSLLFLFAGCTFFNLSITSVERLYAVSKPLTHAARVTLPGTVKTVVSAWVIWLVYTGLLETVAPKVIYQPLESITLTSVMVTPITGHILTFLAIHSNNKKISNATHNSQQAILFKRAKMAFINLAFYTVTTLLSLLPILVLLNMERTFLTSNVLFPWAVTIGCLVSSVNPCIQIWRNTALRQAMKAIIPSNPFL